MPINAFGDEGLMPVLVNKQNALSKEDFIVELYLSRSEISYQDLAIQGINNRDMIANWVNQLFDAAGPELQCWRLQEGRRENIEIATKIDSEVQKQRKE